MNIATGHILISRTEDCDCPVEMVLTKSMRNLAFKLANLSASQTLPTHAIQASLIVTGTPSGASLFLNNKFIGKIPLKETRISAGEYELKVKAQGLSIASK